MWTLQNPPHRMKGERRERERRARNDRLGAM